MNFLSIKKGNKYVILFTLNQAYIHNKNEILLHVQFKNIGVWEKWSRININTYALCASIYQNVYTKTIILYIYCIMYKHTVVSINTQIRIQKLLCIGVVNTLCCLLLRKHAKYYSNAFFVFSNTNNLFIFVVSAKTGILLKN